MLNMALAGRVVTDWVKDPGAVSEFGTRFTRPVYVPDDAVGATVEFTGVVSALDPKPAPPRSTVTAKFNGQTVLGGAKATGPAQLSWTTPVQSCAVARNSAIRVTPVTRSSSPRA